MWRIIDLVYDEAYSSHKKPEILYAAAVYRETEEGYPLTSITLRAYIKTCFKISLSSCSLPQAQYLEAWRNQSICERHNVKKLNIKTSDDYFVHFYLRGNKFTTPFDYEKRLATVLSLQTLL